MTKIAMIVFFFRCQKLFGKENKKFINLTGTNNLQYFEETKNITGYS
jgi:hypothetical protein